jgi:hypothetical protein
MLVVADDEGAPDSDEPQPKPQCQSEVIATQLRQRSMALHDEMQQLLDDEEDVEHETLRAWVKEIRQLNQGVGALSRLAAQRVDRLHVEISLMQNAMLSDVLDREATHTRTLEEIVELSSVGEVARAMRVVNHLHSGTTSLTSDAPLAYFGSEVCADAAPSADVPAVA